MSRLSAPKRKKFFDALVRRDGCRCFIGGEVGTAKTLVIDHFDNDNSNNTLSNLHLMCRSMNTLKNPRRPARKQSSVCMAEVEPENIRVNSAEFAKNLEAEPDFRHWLFAEVWAKGKLDWDEALDCGASVAHCSQETVRRYLRKETCRVRPYMVVEEAGTKVKSIVFRAPWEKARLKEMKRRTLDQQARNWLKKDVPDSVSSGKQKISESQIGKVHELRKAGPF